MSDCTESQHTHPTSYSSICCVVLFQNSPSYLSIDGDPTKGADMQKLAQAEGQLTGALGRLMAVAEAYPDLKANENMMQLTEELTTTENKVAFSRQAYNDSCMTYNEYKQTFPPVFFSNMFGFDNAEYFEIEEAEEREAPKVSF